MLQQLRKLSLDDYFSIYAELIAIKPGFHEIWLHDNYFDIEHSDISQLLKPRDKIFSLLQTNKNISGLTISTLPRDINSKSYFSYASCAITEGPIVYRKDKSLSYFQEIRNIETKAQKKKLLNNFIILDYQEPKLNTRTQLSNFIEMASKYDIY